LAPAGDRSGTDGVALAVSLRGVPAVPSAYRRVTLLLRSLLTQLHAGHGADLGQLVGGETFQFFQAHQTVLDKAGKDEQQSGQTEIEAPFDFMASDAQIIVELPDFFGTGQARLRLRRSPIRLSTSLAMARSNTA